MHAWIMRRVGEQDPVGIQASCSRAGVCPLVSGDEVWLTQSIELQNGRVLAVGDRLIFEGIGP